jgi:hypothetical protein
VNKNEDKQENGENKVKNDFFNRYRESKDTDETVQKAKPIQESDILPKTSAKPLEKNIPKDKISEKKIQVNAEPKTEDSKKISPNVATQSNMPANNLNIQGRDPPQTQI